MPRYIDADELYKKIFPLDVVDKRRYSINAKAVAEAIVGMPTADVAPRAEWISVEERLPQVTGKYICCVKDKRGNTWTVPADWNLEMKMWFGEFGEIKNMVTHWMPLPEPPEGD